MDILPKCFENITNIENNYYAHVIAIFILLYNIVIMCPKYSIIKYFNYCYLGSNYDYVSIGRTNERAEYKVFKLIFRNLRPAQERIKLNVGFLVYNSSV